ncbi:3-isopropylmalate/(R)-2-methylmalate dehydratase large subunit [Desulfofundulus luciae]|uniref:3-isopropylmalate dehydratase large subunit n=1 Tax=Desulfofundulus luciae TaxID=74702 RepID=A0ABU0AY16_9FIRM|nr:3-isopropylmalate dehydratase large subunit [Desulfofundulus luciae]MDQ0285379.1 3-isopropylmalate/(R)-2-methylmalate dehydratase large subunit [Desulfofundulus luciae]
MGMTMAEKILARKAGKTRVSPGEIVMARVDCAMMDDILGPRVQIADELKRLGATIWDRQKVVVISDHYAPAANVKQAEILAFTRRWVQEVGIENYYEGQGPCHQILAEKGFSLPGTLLVGTDSHTCTAGAFGCFGTGIGSTEMLGVMVTGQIWLRVPETIRINWEGTLARGVMAKDVVLKTIGDIGHAGATYKVMEFAGSAIRQMPLDERMCLTNMAVEAGAKTGLIEPDEQVFDFLSTIGRTGYEPVYSDPDAAYSQVLSYNAGGLDPQVACPHEVDNIRSVDQVAGIKIDQAYLGSCTGGRFHDLAVAAQILKNRRVAPHTRLLVSPASRDIWLKASRAGILDVLAEAGAMILAPSCGACLGLHSGILAAGERCISATNRNFIGRMGSKESEVYLASPATVAASAVEGRIADPRHYL